MWALFAPPRPWHVVVAPAVPILALLGNNQHITPPEVIVWPLITSMAAAALLWFLLLLPMKGDGNAAGLVATILILAGMSSGALVHATESLGRGLIPIGYASLSVASLGIVRRRRPAASTTVFLNNVLSLTVLFLAVPIAWAEVVRVRASVEPLSIVAKGEIERPDVYVLVLDAYARADVLRDYHGFRNDLVADLRKLGFFVADSAISNYAHTALSLASALNTDYLPQLGFPDDPSRDTRRGLADLIRDNRFFRAFADAGYYIRSYSSEYAMVQPSPVDDRLAPLGHLNEFGFSGFEASVLPEFFEFVGLSRSWIPSSLHRRHLQWTLSHFGKSSPTNEDRPALVFAHLLAPHPPFVFDADGGARQSRVPALFHDGGDWHLIAQDTGETYSSGYRDTVRFLNRRVLEAVVGILSRRSRPSIILVHGDHGSGSNLNWESPAHTDMRERLGILLALRFPGGEAPPIDADATPINAYRAVVNRSLGAALPSLDNRAFFSTWTKPFAYIDVTEQTKCVECKSLPRGGP